MHAEIISIGDELTSGQNLDTNSQWLSQRLGELGVRVLYHTTVADDLDANIRVIRTAGERADLVFATGGLGPTADDLTRDALAAVAGVDLVQDAATLAWLVGLFQRRGREMPERNRVQALFPKGSRIIPNPHGTAPGVDLDLISTEHRSRIFALPGVPAEMKEMWEQTVVGQIRSLIGGEIRVIRHKLIKCFGVGESDLEKMLPDLIRRGRYPQVGITVSGATITLRITTAEPTAEMCEVVMQPTIQTIHDCLGTLVFGSEDDELQHAVVRQLNKQSKTVATAEWGTLGLLASWLGAAASGGSAFRGGIVVPNQQALSQTLDGTSQSFAEKFPSGPEVAREMAVRCREKFAADFGLAVGAFPLFDPNASEPGLCHFALATSAGVTVKSAPFAAHPELLKPRAAKQTLNLLRLHLLHRDLT